LIAGRQFHPAEFTWGVFVDVGHEWIIDQALRLAGYHKNGTNMRLPTLLPLALALAMSAQEPAPPARQPHPFDPDADVRLPNGKLQKDEILKADFQKSLDEARELSKLADELKADLEKNDRYVLSIPTLKKTEDIEKLAKRIHDRMKHY
jgi:hypothetical protein